MDKWSNAPNPGGATGGRYKVLLEAVPEVIVVLDCDSGRFVDFNSRATDFFGLDRESLLSVGPGDVSPDVQADGRPSTEVARAKISEALEGGRPVFDWIHAHSSGRTIDCEIRLVRFPAEDRPLVCGTITDITDRHRAEVELRESRERLQIATESADIGVWDWLIETNRVTWSDQTYRIFGLEPGAFGGTLEAYTAQVHPEDIDRARAEIERVLADGGRYSSTHRILRHDGQCRWIEATGRVGRGDDGRPLRLVGTVIDITERRAAERRLESAEALFRTLFDELPDAAVVLDGETLQTLRLNGRAARLFGVQEASAPVSIAELLEVPWRSVFVEACRAAPDASSEGRELEVFESDGTVRKLRMTLARFALEGRPAIQAVFRDETELRRTERELREREEQLWHAQRMEAIGRLASGVAHDFNNLLTIISGYAQIAREGLSGEDPACEALAVVLDAARDAEAVTGSLLTFSRLAEGGTEDVDLAAVVERTAGLIRRTLPASIELAVDTARARDARVRGDADQLGQVLMNLAINARDAMPDGGHLDVVLEPQGDHLALSVTDDGPGIAPELQSTIFEPYFTTKPRGKGTGLGLAILHGIVQGLGGRVDLDSAVGRGSTFTVRLPRVDDSRDTPRTAPPAAAPEEGRLGGRVLVAEDNPQLRQLVEQTLRGAGLEVVAVHSGTEALASVRAEPDGFDLLVLDHDLPGMHGSDCLRRVRELGNLVPAVIVTGAPEFELDRSLERVDLLRKPFDRQRLLELVRAYLAGPG